MADFEVHIDLHGRTRPIGLARSNRVRGAETILFEYDDAWLEDHDRFSLEPALALKRIAIATRWGMATAGPADARLSVRDPVEEGEPHTQEEKDALFIGMLRLHIANLIKPLGHTELADALRSLTLQSFPRRLQGETQRARSLLDASPVRDVEKASAAMDGLIGGIVTRAGPLTDIGVEPADQEALSRLNLRPVFVGVEHELIRAAIDAEPQAIRSRLADKESPDEFARPDRAGGWIIPLGQERRIIGGT